MMEHLSTILVALVLAAIAGLILRSILRRTRRGECACGCSGCANAGNCHGITKAEFEKRIKEKDSL